LALAESCNERRKAAAFDVRTNARNHCLRPATAANDTAGHFRTDVILT
jgi:hypothetical protein